MPNNEKLTRKVICYNGQYRITIPKHIAQLLSLNDKDEMEFLLEHGDIVMRKVEG